MGCTVNRRKSGPRSRKAAQGHGALGAVMATAGLLSILGDPIPVAAQEKAPAAPREGLERKAEVILDKYLEALGGRAALGKIRDRVSKGTLEFVEQGKKATFTLYEAAPASMYFVMEFADLGRFERGTNGTVCWASDPMTGPRILTGPERNQVLQNARFNRELHWRASFKKAEWAGLVDTEGRACHKLTMTPWKGNPETWYFDKTTYFLVRRDITIVNRMGRITVEGTLNDYKKVDDILIPHRLNEKTMGSTQIMKFASVAHNVRLPPERFEPPPEVKALIGKP